MIACPVALHPEHVAIRVVDELPEVLFYKLNNGQTMRLIPLPEIDDDPRDEDTKRFRDALANTPSIEGVLRDPGQLVFQNAGFVVTGAFSMGPRKVIERWILKRGGAVAKSVSRNTDYLVIAAVASRDWLHSHQGTKIIEARKLREIGGRPHFVEEVTFRKALEGAL